MRCAPSVSLFDVFLQKQKNNNRFFKFRPIILIAIILAGVLAINTLTSNATSAVRTISSKEDWEGGQISNLSTNSNPGDIELSPTGYYTARSWQHPPNTLGTGNASVAVGSDIYVLRGLYDKAFYKYSSSENTWTVLPEAPVSVSLGSALVSDGSGNIFAIFGRNTRLFYKYIIASNTWERVADTPDTTGSASAMVYTGGKIYLIRSMATQDFWGYTVATNRWDTLRGTLATFNSTNVMDTDGTYIYAARGTNIWDRYNISSNTWEQMTTNLPTTLNQSTGAIYRNGSIYLVWQNSTTFYKCEISGLGCVGNTWLTLANLPAISQYSNMVYNSVDGYIYIIRGTSLYDIWKYDISTNTFVGPASSSFNFTTGGDIFYDGSTGVYALKGGAAAGGFWYYSMSLDTWTAKSITGLPALSYDMKGVKAGNKIYIFQGNSASFFAYDTTNDAAGWVAKANAPANVSDGANMIYPGGDYIYALRGASTNNFYAYHIADNNWTTLDPADLPSGFTVSVGSRMATNGTDIYASIGAGSSRFYKYNILSDSWEEATSLPFGAYYGVDFAYNNGKVYSTGGNYRNEMFEYDTSDNSWRRLKDLQSRTNLSYGFWSGTGIDYIGNDSLIVAMGGYNDAFIYNIESNDYEASGTFESDVMDLTHVSQWSSLSVDAEIPTGSSISLATKTSQDNATWPEDWTAVSGTNIASDEGRYLKIKLTLQSNEARDKTPVVSSINLVYNPDQVDPGNPSVETFRGVAQTGGLDELTSGQSYRNTHPEFSWDPGTDSESGVAGYYVYFGNNQNADPEDDGTYQTSTSYEVYDKINIGNNYLLIKTKDNAGNVSGESVLGFTYNYIGADSESAAISGQDDFNEGEENNVSTSSSGLSLASKSGFWRESLLSTFPVASAPGASLITKGNVLYMTKGTNNAFYSYDIASDTWSILSSVGLGNITTDGGLVNGPGNYIYAYRGNAQSSFYRYDVTDDASGWSDVDAEDTPSALATGCSSVFDGSRYIYFFKGSSNIFYRFDTQDGSDGSWSTLELVNFGTNTANSNTASGSFLAYDGDDTIYATQGGAYSGGFSKYSIVNDTWTPLEYLPVGPNSGASLVWDENTSKLYLLPSNSLEYLYSYEPLSSTWEKLSDAPVIFAAGTAMTIHGDYLYIEKGGTTSLYRYRISKNSWESPNMGVFSPNFQGSSPLNSNLGAAIIKGDGNNFYLTRGSYDTKFVRFDSATGVFYDLPRLPAGSYLNSSFAYDSDENDIYFLPSTESKFYKFDIDTQIWEYLSLDYPPIAPTNGASMVYGDGYVYYFRGGTAWYRFDVGGEEGSRWSAALPTTGMVAANYGSSAVYKDDYIYLSLGSTTNPNTFAKIDASGLPDGSWTALSSLPSGGGYGQFFVDGNNGKFYMASAHNTNKFFEYDLDQDSWTQITNFPGKIYQGGTGDTDKNGKVFAITGSGTGSYQNAIYTFIYQSLASSFEENGDYVSPEFDIGAYEFANISLTYQEKNNTTVTVYTQTSSDGESWSSWAEANGEKVSGSEEKSHQYKINSSPERYFKYKISFMSGDSVLSPVIEDVTVNYYADNDSPTSPQSLKSALSQKTGGTAISGGEENWHNYSSAYFQLPSEGEDGAASDGSNGSGVAGYYVYFGELGSAIPSQSRGIANQLGEANLRYQEAQDLELGVDTTSLESGKTYYLIVQSKDNAGNVSTTPTTLFEYQFDNTSPNEPETLTATQNSQKTQYTFTWPAVGVSGGAYDPDPDDQDATISPSGIKGYKYKTSASGTWSDVITESGITLDNSLNNAGENIFYLLAIDNALNISDEKIVKFYIAPGGVINLTSLPSTNADNPATANNFKFTWSAPENISGTIKQYRYSVNQTPSSSNTTDNIVATTFIDYGSHATQQGKNTLYVVAEGDWGGSNVNYDQYASVDFYIQTENPDPPEGVQITDSSNRVLDQYRLTITWNAPTSGPEAQEYVVKRSTDNSTFETVGSTTSTGYLDSGLSGDDTYYYRVLSKDSAGALSIESADLTTSKKPTGKYTEPPEIANSSIVSNIGATTADISWITDRSSDSFVEYGTTEDLGMSFGQREETREHKVSLSGLKAGTKYYFKCQSLDPGDLRDYSQDVGYSDIFELTTTAAPTLSDVSFSTITTNSAIVSFQTNKTSIARIQYGTSTDYDKEINDSAGSGTSQHTVLLDSLQDDTTYQLKITITDDEGNQIESPGHSFTTLAMPRIESVSIESQKDSAETSVKMTFITNVEALGAVEYSSSGADKKELASSEYKKVHEFTVSGLQDQQTYIFQALGRDRFGNEARSDTKSFDTPNDSRPPIVSDIVIETSNVGVGREDEAQMIVSWKTDEPTTSKVEYGEGISGDQYNQSTSEDGSMTNSHLVVVSGLSDNSPYHLRVCSKDKGSNLTCSGDNTVVPGEAKKSLFTILLNTFQNTFGWLGGLI